MNRYDPYNYTEKYSNQYQNQNQSYPNPNIQPQQYYPQNISTYNNLSINQLNNINTISNINRVIPPIDTSNVSSSLAPTSIYSSSPNVGAFADNSPYNTTTLTPSIPVTPDIDHHSTRSDSVHQKKHSKRSVDHSSTVLFSSSSSSSPTTVSPTVTTTTSSASSSTYGTPVAQKPSSSTTKSGKPRARYISVRDPECVHALRCLVEAVRIFPRRNSNQFSKECLEMAAQGWRDWQAQNNRPVDATVAQIRAHYHNKMNEWAAWNKRAANPENRVVEDRVYFKDCHGKIRSARRLPAELEHLISELHKSLPRPGYTKRKSELQESDSSVGNTPKARNGSTSSGSGSTSTNATVDTNFNTYNGMNQNIFSSSSSGVNPSSKVEKEIVKQEVFDNNVFCQSSYPQRMLPPVNSMPLTHIASNPLVALPGESFQNQYQQQQAPNQTRPLESWSYNQYSQYQANQQQPTQYQYPSDLKSSYSLQSLLHPQSDDNKGQ